MVTDLTALGLAGGSAHAEDRYFLVMFAAQGEPNLPHVAHSFAAFVKASGDGEFPKDYKTHIKTISWLPAKGTVQLLRLLPEPGKNFDLAATLSLAKANSARVSAWGPIEVKKEFYDHALQQVQRLESGKIAFLAVDVLFRGEGASNCIHALSDLDPKQPALTTGTAYGEAASLLVLRHFDKWLVNPEADHRWIIDRLDLKDPVGWLAVEKAAQP